VHLVCSRAGVFGLVQPVCRRLFRHRCPRRVLRQLLHLFPLGASSSPERVLLLTKGESTNALAQAALAIILIVRGGMPDFSATARSCSSITARA
jgi:hypothetical protein